MSVYIPNMEMPATCFECPFMFARRYCCADLTLDLYQGDYEELKGRVDGCPLVPVPPHGRLVEESEVKNRIANFISDDDFGRGWNAALKRILEATEDAPPIIPASEEGVKTEEDSEPWLCLSCRHYPPSSTDGKPCTQCNPSEVWHSCYDPAEEGEGC